AAAAPSRCTARKTGPARYRDPGVGAQCSLGCRRIAADAAARERMAETGEPYAAARRAGIREQQAAGAHSPPPDARGFAISYGDDWPGRLTDSLDRLFFRAGRGVLGAEVARAVASGAAHRTPGGPCRVYRGDEKVNPMSSQNGCGLLSRPPPLSRAGGA